MKDRPTAEDNDDLGIDEVEAVTAPEVILAIAAGIGLGIAIMRVLLDHAK